MATFTVGKDYETPNRAGAGDGAFQVDELRDDNGNDVTGSIDQGIIFQSDDELRDYLSRTFGIPAADIDIDEL